MISSFSTPTDYLTHIQQKYAQAYPSGTADKEFERITNNQLSKSDLSLSELGPYGGLRIAIENLEKNILASIEAEIRTKILTNIAIGVLPTGEANAFIARSPDGKYALVIGAGLMLLLHKYLKLIRAFVSPSEIVHCNRKPVSTITKDDLNSYIVELIDNYIEFGVPYGPMIKLSDEAMMDHGFLLDLAERFIVCHELGHYLNGDLEDELSYSAFDNPLEGKKYEENCDHEIEFLADIVGFELLLKSLDKQKVNLPSIELIKPILAMFNLFYAIGGGETSSHPHPYDRVCMIVEHHYGMETARKIEDALHDPSLLPKFFQFGSMGSE